MRPKKPEKLREAPRGIEDVNVSAKSQIRTRRLILLFFEGKGSPGSTFVRAGIVIRI
jgi:hypothetical protein